jgi:predicted ester cyclase
MHWSVEEQIEEDNKVVSRLVSTGTHRAEFLGVPATGCSVSVWGIAIDRIVDGKIKDTRIIMEALGQMGALPPRAG